MLKEKKLKLSNEVTQLQKEKKVSIDKAYKVLLENREKRLKTWKNIY
ncbi:MAG: hypothetical protein JJT76_09710 [Clostridiaceae bacterium]|nr:hypothetical protein [Clostridiaceae bacterium]